MADDKHKGHKNKNKKRESGCTYNEFADKFRSKKCFCHCNGRFLRTSSKRKFVKNG